MKRGSTQPIIITIPGIDLTSAEWLIVSISRQCKLPLELSEDRLTVSYSDNSTIIAFELTQAESLTMDGTVTLDINWMLDGQRDGVIPQTVNFSFTLLNREVE